jgi:hypothetical protein
MSDHGDATSRAVRPKKSGDSKTPAWVTVLIAISSAVIAAAATYFPNMSKLSFEREKFKAEQERANRLESQPGKTVRIDGQYEWQWAGDGWKGHISVTQDGTAHIEMMQYKNCGGSLKTLPLLEQKGDAKMELMADSAQMRVSIPVQFINYDSNCTRTGMNPPTTLRGDLDRHVAYAGKIEYRSDLGAPLGDMVLIKDYISGRD